MAKTAAVLLAEGFEEIEAITPIDILRRAGVAVTVAGLGGLSIAGAHGVTVGCDAEVASLETVDLDAVVLPGGMPGSKNLAASEAVRALCVRQAEAGRVVAAICAAPALALASFGVLDNRRATCYPGFAEHFPSSATAVADEPVVVDGPVVTSRGPGTAFAFGLTLAALLAGDETAATLKSGMQYA